ncbi:MAG: DUF4249 domain-containing protein [Saprospiraceae bacterium]|nr:DUF4249 domain-containing protein [Saprospiraceae bacterium]
MKTNISILYKRRLFQVLALLGISIGLWNCQDTIDVALDDAPQLLVVDAWLNNLPETQTIRLSLTQPYFDNQLSNGVNDATVTMVDDQGNMTSFQGKGDGNYTWTPTGEESLGEVGRTYTLNIDWNGKTYTGSTPMAAVPPIDSITQEFRVDDIRGPDGIYCQFFARDLAGLGNAYWIKTYKNEQFLNKPQEINIAFDAAFSPGAEADGLIFITPIREAVNRFPDPDTDDNDEVAPWNPGDSIHVEIHSMTLTAFRFLTIARDQMTNGDNTIFAIPLANTTGNMKSSQADEDVLGIFNMAAVSSLGDLIEEQ